MLIDAFLESLRRYPDKTAVIDPIRRLTYSQLATFACVIRSLVMSETRCERVGVMMPASGGGLGTLLGVMWAGKTPIPLNFLLQTRELAGVISDSGIDLLITTEHFKDQTATLPVRTLFVEQLNLKWRYFWARLRGLPRPPAVRPDDDAVILYTSGTTGHPKGVCLTHNNLMSNIRAALTELRIEPDARLLGVIPPFHVFGLSVVTLLPMVLGGTVNYIPRFSPQATYKAICTEAISILLAVPSMYAAIARLKSLERAQFSKVFLAASGGEPLPRTVYDMFYEKTGLRLVEGYGLTETSPIISIDLPWRHKVGTVGTPLPNVEIQIRDEAGRVLPRDAEGELYVRGPSVMKGYYKKPQETAAVIDREGWFRTGDVIRLDAEGSITITGRAKDLIITGGENVYPREVESVLEQHPAVAEAAVVGQPDESRGEVVVGFVTLREGARADANELRTYCKDHLAGFKVPRAIHICGDFPRGPTGKILKRDLKKQLLRDDSPSPEEPSA